MTLSTKNIVIIILSIATISLGIYYYTTYTKPSSDQQIEGNWLYRKSLDIENKDEVPLAEQDILVTINTKELVDAFKLKTDCSDLRFVDEDNLSHLKYWIEGGCNSEETQVWVRVPLIPQEGKSIYMYYGNEYAQDAQETWNGKFLIQRETHCTGKWTEESNFEGRYIKGGNEYGVEEGLETHTHTIKTDTIDCHQQAFLTEEGSKSCTSGILNKQLSSVQTSLPSFEVYYCSNNDGLLESDSFAMIDHNTTPKGWVDVEGISDKFVIGRVEKQNISKNTHSHTPICKEDATEGDNDTYILKSSKISSSATTPPYYKVKYIKNIEKSFFSPNSIGIFTILPPLGWEYYSNIEGYFPYGASQGLGETGGEENHEHTLQLQFEKTKSSFSSDEYICLDNTKKTLTISSKNSPWNISVIFAKKKNSLKVSLSSESAIFEKKKDTTLVENKEEQEKVVAQKEVEIKENGAVLGIVAPNQPTELLTDGRTNPSYILSSTPSFSAIYTDPDEDNSSAYQIEVSDNTNFTGTAKWDSGKISTTISNNSRSSDFTYAGSPLTNSGSTLYWRIRFWDIDDDMSDWSETATFVDLYNHTKMEGLRLNGININ